MKEYDSVPQLMSRRDSTFRAMVVEAQLETPPTSRVTSAANLVSLSSVAEEGAEEGAAAGEVRRGRRVGGT